MAKPTELTEQEREILLESCFESYVQQIREDPEWIAKHGFEGLDNKTDRDLLLEVTGYNGRGMSNARLAEAWRKI